MLGNTDLALDKALEGAAKHGAYCEKIFLETLDISACAEIEYEKVTEEGLSVVNDDMHVVFNKILETDILIVASPVFFGSISAQAKIMIDRFQCVWVSKNIMNKDVFNQKIIGGFICVAAVDKKDFFNNSKYIIKNFFKTINCEYHNDTFLTGVDEKGSIFEHPGLLNHAFELGENLALEAQRNKGEDVSV